MSQKSKIITNSTPIIGLSIVGQLKLLAELFEKVYVPNAVYQEIILSNSPRKYDKDELKKMINEDIFKIY